VWAWGVGGVGGMGEPGGGGGGEEPPPGAGLVGSPAPPTCTERLDRAFACASSSAQLRELYRYGELRDCRPLFSAFYDCLLSRTRIASPEEVRPSYQELTH